jgi:hypothetical protein
VTEIHIPLADTTVAAGATMNEEVEATLRSRSLMVPLPIKESKLLSLQGSIESILFAQLMFQDFKSIQRARSGDYFREWCK